MGTGRRHRWVARRAPNRGILDSRRDDRRPAGGRLGTKISRFADTSSWPFISFVALVGRLKPHAPCTGASGSAMTAGAFSHWGNRAGAVARGSPDSCRCSSVDDDRQRHVQRPRGHAAVGTWTFFAHWVGTLTPKPNDSPSCQTVIA